MSRTQLQVALFALKIWTLFLRPFVSVCVRCLWSRLRSFADNLSLAIPHLGMSWETLLDPVVKRSQRSLLPASQVMAPTDFIWNHERWGHQSLSWSETPRLSVGLRVQVRRRVAGDDPRTDHNNDGKGGGCLSVWSSVCVSGSWSCACLVFPGAGRWVSVSVLASSLVVGCCPCLPGSGSCAGFREKGRRPKNRSRRSFARAGPFQVFPGMLAVLERRYRDRILTLVHRGLFPLLTASSVSGKASPHAFNPPAGASGRTSTCRAGSPWRFTFPSLSLSSLLFVSIVASLVPLYRYVSPRTVSEVAKSLDVRVPSPFLLLSPWSKFSQVFAEEYAFSIPLRSFTVFDEVQSAHRKHSVLR